MNTNDFKCRISIILLGIERGYCFKLFPRMTSICWFEQCSWKSSSWQCSFFSDLNLTILRSSIVGLLPGMLLITWLSVRKEHRWHIDEVDIQVEPWWAENVTSAYRLCSCSSCPYLADRRRIWYLYRKPSLPFLIDYIDLSYKLRSILRSILRILHDSSCREACFYLELIFPERLYIGRYLWPWAQEA